MNKMIKKTKDKIPVFVLNKKCPFCNISLKKTYTLFEKTKCRKCSGFFFLVRTPEKFFVLS